MHERDPLPELAVLEFALDYLPREREITAVAGFRRLNAGLDDLSDVFADWQQLPRVAFLGFWIEGFRKLRIHRETPFKVFRFQFAAVFPPAAAVDTERAPRN